MRKMFSQKQIESLSVKAVNEGIESGEVKVPQSARYIKLENILLADDGVIDGDNEELANEIEKSNCCILSLYNESMDSFWFKGIFILRDKTTYYEDLETTTDRRCIMLGNQILLDINGELETGPWSAYILLI
ncbi:MAG: hypothetical protein J6S85_24750 [Methanobrevibacter sp.]|nr:hypothetical protein [Methanobrevibacter sp.]